MEWLTVVKIGGNIIDDPAELASFLRDFAGLEGSKLLVHGGGVGASDMLCTLGIEPRMAEGRRITDAATLKIVTMVYAGWINKSVVAGLQAAGCNALGLSGADGNTVTASKRVSEPVDYGWVGDIVSGGINVPFLRMLSEGGIVPVMCAITHDGYGNLLNTNADTIAATVSAALTEIYRVRLIYCFEKRGVLADPEDDSSVLPSLDSGRYAEMKKGGAVRAGMIAKLDNAFSALRNGVTEVYVRHAADLTIADSGTSLIL